MFNKIKITTSLTILIISFVTMHIISSCISVYRSALNDNNFSKTVTLNHQIDSLAAIKLNLIQSRLDTYRAAASLIENNPVQFESDLGKAIANLNGVQKEMDYFLSLDNPLTTNAELIKNLEVAYTQLFTDLRYQQAKLKTEGFMGYRAADVHLTQENFLRITDEVIFNVSNLLKEYDALSAKMHEHSFNQFIIETVLLILMLLGAIRWNYVVLKKPLNDLISHFTYISNGDLSKKIEYCGKNEIAQLFSYFEKMQSYLIETVQVVRNSSDILVEGVSHVVLKNSDLAVRTDQQASSIQQTASSMDELTETVKLNALNASKASEIADFSAKAARKGEEITQTVTNTMDSIKESASKIADILNMIDSIAFQTNILALNAAVEAARAGELGRGFAVVADEVRNLALRSAEAATEIKQLIEESNQRVLLGSNLVNVAGDTMREIVHSVAKVNALIAEISTASTEQSIGIEVVSRSIRELDTTIQENGNLVNDLSSSAQVLESQSFHLIKSVSLFRII
ncbi:methyl-accepting chemotaxis protein [Thorsellia kenyensis]|uniref:Methyl-accepting chemotaxis protein n=1 Tax=Thorsellia kenyensis TaxID=1549888 RepID=A0ABV6C7Y1_9GAMM